MENRTFTLGQLLNITTGRVLTNMDDINVTMEYLYGKDFCVGDISDNRKKVADYIISVYPNLSGVGQKDVFIHLSDIAEFLEKQTQILGNEFTLSPMDRNTTN